MQRSRFALAMIVSAIAAPIMAFAARVHSAVVLAIEYLFPITPSTLRLAGFPRLDAAGIAPIGLSPALQHSLRHEAGVSRRAAARNT